MRDIVLVYFDGCPHAERARQELCSLGLAFEEVRQNTLESGDPMLRYSSPTVLCDGRVVLGTLIDEAGSCTIASEADYQGLRALLSSRDHSFV